MNFDYGTLLLSLFELFKRLILLFNFVFEFKTDKLWKELFSCEKLLSNYSTLEPLLVCLLLEVNFLICVDAWPPDNDWLWKIWVSENESCSDYCYLDNSIFSSKSDC